MGFVEIITKLFGNKSQKDMRAVMPYVEKIKSVYAQIDALSDDELRAAATAQTFSLSRETETASFC